MPVPSSIASLSTTRDSNPPAGNTPALPEMDDHIRQAYAFIAALRDGKLDASAVSDFMLTVLNDVDAAAARATLGALGLVVATPSAGTDAANKAYVDAAISGARVTGEIRAMARLTAPAGWLLIDGRTVGNAASGGTARANADTAALFAELWAFPAASVPIFDSTGAASTRGASAAADFAANKRIALFTPDGGAFLRMWTPGQTRDAGRAAGSAQADAIRDHYHAQGSESLNNYYGGGSYVGGRTYPAGESNSIAGQHTSGVQGIAAEQISALETRPYNLALPHYIAL